MTEDIVRMLLALTVAVGTTTDGVEALTALHSSASFAAAQLQSSNDAQTLRAARIANALTRGSLTATEAELIAAGFLVPEWSQREAVDTSPVVLPPEMAAEALDEGAVDPP